MNLEEHFWVRFLRNRTAEKYMHTSLGSASGHARDLLKMTGILLIVTFVGFVFFKMQSTDASIIIMYILGVLIVSLISEHHLYGILMSILSVIVYDYFFIEPCYMLQMNGETYPATLLVMLTVSCVTSTLVRCVKRQANESAQKAHHMEVLLEMSQKLQHIHEKTEIFDEIASQIHLLLGCAVLVYPVKKDGLDEARMKGTQRQAFSQDEKEVLLWVYQNRDSAGFGSKHFPRARCICFSLCNNSKMFAVIVVDLRDRIPIFDAFQKNLLLALISECALALEKEEAQLCQKESELQAQNEKLRAILLRGISHDLRTPLTSISGNAGILMDNLGEFDDAKKMQLYTDIYDDSMWLITLVENLLAVTRFEDGVVNLRQEAELFEEVIAEALNHISRRNNNNCINVQVADDLLMSRMDSRLIIQVIINLVDNAIKYTPEGSHIFISVLRRDEWAVVEISDDGFGIPEESKDKLFDMFYTIGNDIGDGRRSLGLGLALCKSIINAHGGHIWVRDNIPQGAVLGFSLLAEEVTVLE